MGTFVETKGRRNSFAIRLDQTFGDREILLDITTIVQQAKQYDDSRGYSGIGPAAAVAIEHATEYADYVGQYATPETLHEFNTRSYTLTTRERKEPKKKKTPDVRANVSL